jgi:hypothetical protein
MCILSGVVVLLFCKHSTESIHHPVFGVEAINDNDKHKPFQPAKEQSHFHFIIIKQLIILMAYSAIHMHDDEKNQHHTAPHHILY